MVSVAGASGDGSRLSLPSVYAAPRSHKTSQATGLFFLGLPLRVSDVGRPCGCTQAWQLGATGLGDVGFLGRWHEDFCAPGLCLGCVLELGTWGLGGDCKWLCLNSDSSIQMESRCRQAGVCCP